MKKLLAVFLTFFSLSAFAQWQTGATPGSITYSGNVGINTASPTEALHVAGGVKLSGGLKVGTYLKLPTWTSMGSAPAGYIKLITPIAQNESNMFSIHIVGYNYGSSSAGARVIEIRCSGFANGALGVLTQASCATSGTTQPVELATELRPNGTQEVVVVRIGSPTSTGWTNSYWTADYTGLAEKSADGFVWVKGETTPEIGANMNNTVLDDFAGTLALGASLTSGTRLTVGGTTHFAGNVAIGIAPNTLYRLSTLGPANTTSFANNPLTMTTASSNAFSTVNDGAGLGFSATYNSAGALAVIGAISAVKESTVDGNYAGALTFGTRQAGSGSGSMERMRIRSSGEVVIGQSGNTGTKLTVNGDVVATGSITGVRVFNAVYQDIAEWVPATEDMVPGTVVVLSPHNINEVMPSSLPYDTRVAGVVSEQPGVLLGIGGASKEQIATTGRVKVRVDATAAPIAIGDLLVTSGASGAAMKSIPVALGDAQIHRPGTIIGKALQPLESGVGEILVLLSLQ